MSQNDLLFTISQEFNSKKADMSPEKVTSVDMAHREQTDDNKYYNLNGQEVKHPTKGMYIRNGRKVIVR